MGEIITRLVLDLLGTDGGGPVVEPVSVELGDELDAEHRKILWSDDPLVGETPVWIGLIGSTHQEAVQVGGTSHDQRDHVGVLDRIGVVEEGVRQLDGDSTVVLSLGDGDLAGVAQRVVRGRKGLDGGTCVEAHAVAQALVYPEADVPILAVLVHTAHGSGDHELAGIVVVVREDVVSKNESPNRELIREVTRSVVVVREILIKVVAGYKRKSTGQNCEYSLFHNHLVIK